MDTSLLHLLIEMGGTVVLAAFGYYVKQEIARNLMQFELRMLKEMEKHEEKYDARDMQSRDVHADLDKRLAIVENGHASISDRLDQLVNAMHGDEQRRKEARVR
jgi:hypothetical protein